MLPLPAVPTLQAAPLNSWPPLVHPAVRRSELQTEVEDNKGALGIHSRFHNGRGYIVQR